MARKVIFNEASLKRALKTIMREYTGDSEEFGRYDIDDNYKDISDEDYAAIDRQLSDKYESEDEWFNDNEAEQFIGRDFYDPSDGDLYRGNF